MWYNIFVTFDQKESIKLVDVLKKLGYKASYSSQSYDFATFKKINVSTFFEFLDIVVKSTGKNFSSFKEIYELNEKMTSKKVFPYTVSIDEKTIGVLEIPEGFIQYHFYFHPVVDKLLNDVLEFSHKINIYFNSLTNHYVIALPHDRFLLENLSPKDYILDVIGGLEPKEEYPIRGVTYAEVLSDTIKELREEIRRVSMYISSLERIAPRDIIIELRDWIDELMRRIEGLQLSTTASVADLRKEIESIKKEISEIKEYLKRIYR